MSRINTNVQSLIAQRVLANNNKQLNQSLERLSTGFRINRGADDPAGLIASENLRSEKAAIDAAISNAERAEQVVNIAEGGLQEVNALLVELQGLVGQSANEAGLSKEEAEANQLQIDSILQTIDRIAQSTSFQGTKLLNGTYDFAISGQNSEVIDFKINAAKAEHDQNRDVDVLIVASAQHGSLLLSLGGANLDLTDAGSRFVFEVAGSKGSREFTFASGASLATVTNQINTFTSVTGVSATTSGTGVVLKSTGYGSNEFVSVDLVDVGGQAGAIYGVSSLDENVANATPLATYATATNPIRDAGQDIGVIINGISATADGKTARITTDFLDVELNFDDAGTSPNAQNLGAFKAFTITGGGARFNLGPNVDILNQVSLGIGNINTRNLGSLEIGYLDELGSSRDANVVTGDLALAQEIVNASIKDVSQLRGRLGAFQKNIVGSTIRSLNIALENTSAAESAIRETDFAKQTAELTRAQILTQASSNILQLANSQPQQVLSLLG